NGETVKSFNEFDKSTLEMKLEKALLCFKAWRNQSFDQRKRVIQKVADLMREKSTELATLIILEITQQVHSLLFHLAVPNKVVMAENFLL
ncbi:MAG: aldehyde dehydrogenase family protein, partial [Oligoflexus sp.]|nr:aldehyde dehydrogenase family protein [Pseudopedobacter sp.]